MSKEIESLRHKLKGAMREMTEMRWKKHECMCLYCWGVWNMGEEPTHSQTCIFNGLENGT